MRHLRTDEFVDIAEGTRAKSSSAHLASCTSCRAQLADVRAAMKAAADADVPEPSPLFWGHLSQRVRDVVAADEAPLADGWRAALNRLSWRLAAAAAIAALAAIALIVFAVTRTPTPATHDARSATAAAPTTAVNRASESPSDASIDADPLLMLVANLASALDVDAGVVLEDSATADHAVTHLTDGELRELQRLLQDYLQQHSGD